jgi:malonyl-CoA O-methyltransferase
MALAPCRGAFMNKPAAEIALPERRATRRRFARAVATFDAACAVHDETRARLLERLDYLRIDPRVAVDVGSATGRGARALAQRYPAARVLALDSSLPMLGAARAAGLTAVAGDAERLPLASRSAQLLLANLVLPFCAPPALFAEAARVLDDGGLLLFATLGPDSLQEIRRAWAAVDRGIHVHAAFDMHDLGDLALAAGLADPVLDADRLVLTYADAAALFRDIAQCGAANVAAGRARGLMGRGRWAAFERALLGARTGPRLEITIEIVLGHAFGRGRGRREPVDRSEIGVPVERIGRRAPSSGRS